MPNTNSKKISIAILAASAVLYAGATWSFVTKDSHNDLVIEKTAKPDPALTPEQSTEKTEPDHKQKDALRAKNMFFVEPKPSVPQVEGILGNLAYYNGNGQKVGDKVGPGAEIIEITNAYVKLKYEGNEITQYPINAPSRSSDSQPRKKPEPKKVEAKNQPVAEMEKAAPPPPAANNDGDDFDKLGLPPHLRDALRARWDALSPEQKSQALEQFNNMSQSEKDRAISEMQRAYDSGQLN